MLDYMNRARKISAHNRGEDDEETKKISSLVAKLAETYAREVSDLLKEVTVRGFADAGSA